MDSARSVYPEFDEEVNGTILPFSLDHLEIPLEDIVLATSNFDDKFRIGCGGFGTIFRGKFDIAAQRSNVISWVKVFHPDKIRSKVISRHGVTESWMEETEILSSYKHENLISLVGYCDKGSECILVYEYASRGTLNQNMSAPTLPWVQRLKICSDIAKGLRYLHTGAKHTRTIHRDVKTSNILLDETWAAKISDFGLSKIRPTMDHTHVSIDVTGSLGYCDPLYYQTGILSKESDVYAFGVVLFEVLCGRLAYANEGTSSSRLKVNGNILPSSLQEFAHLKIPLEDIVLATRNFADHESISVRELFRSGQSIDKQRVHLYNTKNEPLTWERRLKICIGAAKGLQYLHTVTGAEHTIIHRDIKSANILLDENWAAKVSDFGLSKIGPTMDHTHVSIDVTGSLGYCEPLYYQTGILTKESDIYAFGVVLFEILCGQLAYANEDTLSSRLKEMKASRGRNILSRYWRDILPKIEIYITTRPGNTISLVADTSDTIRDLRLKIPSSEWNHRELPDLFYKGEHLNDNCTLDSYNISWFSTLECRLGLNISIRTMSGKTISVKVASSNTTIANLKAKIQDKEGVPQFQQKLFFNGRQLENKCTLADYKIEDGSTLLLVRRSKGWIPMYVKTHAGKTISLEVKSSDTIGDLKIKINEVDDILPYKQNLFLYGEELLDNNCTLTDYNIHPESTLFLVPVCRGQMKIYVETVRGNTITLDVISYYTIGEVKSLIQDKEGIRLHEQTLVYEGQKLDDRRTLVSYLIQDETTLRLVDDTLMRPELMRIHIEIVATGKTIPLQVETFNTISSVKSKIQSKEDIPFELQRLFLPQIQLKDDFTLADYYIQNESTLHLVVTLIKIFVKTANGKIIALDVDSSDTILNVKAKIHDVEEIPRDHQTLLLAEEQLKDSFTVAKYCIKNESTLHLLVT